MAHVETSKLGKHEVQELATVYAALLLSDAGVALDQQKLESIGKAAGVQISGDYAKLFVRALKGKKVESFLSVGGGGGAAAESHTGGAAKAEKAQPKKEEKPEPKKETKKEPVKEEPKDDDLDMGGGMGMFGDDF